MIKEVRVVWNTGLVDGKVAIEEWAQDRLIVRHIFTGRQALQFAHRVKRISLLSLAMTGKRGKK
jgi:hypothetical protein